MVCPDFWRPGVKVTQVMAEPLNMVKLPFKVAIFAANPMAVPTINQLLQQQHLAGVILAEQVDPFSHQLAAWLQQMQYPHLRYQSAQADMITEKLRQWEADLAITFSFPHSLPEQSHQATTYGIYQFHPGPMSLYWQIRDLEPYTQLTLQKVQAAGPDIAAQQNHPIHPMDTLQCLENKVAQQAPMMIGQFIDALRKNQGQLELSVQPGAATAVAFPQESDLYVDWLNMGSEQICALARAGNSQLGGCIIVIGQTPINLLQATAVKHPTYGVKPGTICHTGEPEGVIVATRDGAIRLDILSNSDGFFSGLNFTERFQINAGMDFVAIPVVKKNQ